MQAVGNVDRMRHLAAELLKADSASIAWFRYGATYVVSLLAAIDFYRAADRVEEANDLLMDLKVKTGAADSVETIAQNFIRLGIYWDEATCIDAAARPDLTTEDLLDMVRKPIK